MEKCFDEEYWRKQLKKEWRRQVMTVGCEQIAIMADSQDVAQRVLKECLHRPLVNDKIPNKKNE